MSTKLIKYEIEQPQIPEDWNYDESVKKVKGFIYKWKNLTIEIAQELRIAREKLKAQGRRTDLETKISKLPTWTQYCQDIGSSKEVVNRWLKQFFPTQKVKLPLPKEKFDIIYADPPWKYDFSVSESRAI